MHRKKGIMKKLTLANAHPAKPGFHSITDTKKNWPRVSKSPSCPHIKDWMCQPRDLRRRDQYHKKDVVTIGTRGAK